MSLPPTGLSTPTLSNSIGSVDSYPTSGESSQRTSRIDAIFSAKDEKLPDPTNAPPIAKPNHVTVPENAGSAKKVKGSCIPGGGVFSMDL